jgi:hypothetical protein
VPSVWGRPGVDVDQIGPGARRFRFEKVGSTVRRHHAGAQQTFNVPAHLSQSRPPRSRFTT